MEKSRITFDKLIETKTDEIKSLVQKGKTSYEISDILLKEYDVISEYYHIAYYLHHHFGAYWKQPEKSE